MSDDEKKYLESKVGTFFNKVKWLLFIPYFIESLKKDFKYKDNVQAMLTYQKYLECELIGNKLSIIYEPDKREAGIKSNLDILFSDYEYINAGTFKIPKRKFEYTISDDVMNIFKIGKYSKMYSSNTLSEYKRLNTNIKYMDSNGAYVFPNMKSYYILSKDKTYQKIIEDVLDLPNGTLDNIELESIYDEQINN